MCVRKCLAVRRWFDHATRANTDVDGGLSLTATGLSMIIAVNSMD